MIHIEFLGIPGSGKSTLHRETLATLEERGYSAFDDERALYEGVHRQFDEPIATALDLLPYYPVRKNILRQYASLSDMNSLAYAEFLSQRPEFGSTLLKATSAQKSNRRQERLQRWMFELISRYTIAEEHLQGDEFVLIDEGFCHRATSLFADDEFEGDSELLEQYVARIPVPDVLFFIDCAVETCYERLTEQGGFPYRFQTADREARLSFLKNAERLVYDIVDLITERDVALYQIENEGNIIESVGTIISCLEEADDLLKF